VKKGMLGHWGAFSRWCRGPEESVSSLTSAQWLI